MIAKRRLTIDLECCSSVSEADLCTHIEKMINDMKYHCEQECFHSWNSHIDINWGESYPVSNSITYFKVEHL